MSFLIFPSFSSVSQNTVITLSVPFLCNCESLNEHKEINILGHFKAIKKKKLKKNIQVVETNLPGTFNQLVFCMIQEILSELRKILRSRSDCKSCLREEGTVEFRSDMGTFFRICIKLLNNWNLLSTHVDNSNKKLLLLCPVINLFGENWRGVWKMCLKSVLRNNWIVTTFFFRKNTCMHRRNMGYM